MILWQDCLTWQLAASGYAQTLRTHTFTKNRRHICIRSFFVYLIRINKLIILVTSHIVSGGIPAVYVDEVWITQSVTGLKKRRKLKKCLHHHAIGVILFHGFQAFSESGKQYSRGSFFVILFWRSKKVWMIKNSGTVVKTKKGLIPHRLKYKIQINRLNNGNAQKSLCKMFFLDESHLYIRKNINFAHLFKERFDCPMV